MAELSKSRYVACDETINNRYMVIGGIWCEGDFHNAIHEQIAEFRKEQNMTRELKWNKISVKYLQAYKDYIDLFFKRDELQFRCIVVDTHSLNNKYWHDGDDELAFYKFYYYMLKGKISCGDRYYIYTDHRSNRKRDRLTVLQDCLNNSFSPCLEKPVRAITAQDSKLNGLIQMADILIGAVQCNWNRIVTSPSKQDFVSHVLKRLNFSTLQAVSNYWKFEIFVWKSRSQLTDELNVH